MGFVLCEMPRILFQSRKKNRQSLTARVHMISFSIAIKCTYQLNRTYYKTTENDSEKEGSVNPTGLEMVNHALGTEIGEIPGE